MPRLSSLSFLLLFSLLSLFHPVFAAPHSPLHLRRSSPSPSSSLTTLFGRRTSFSPSGLLTLDPLPTEDSEKWLTARAGLMLTSPASSKNPKSLKKRGATARKGVDGKWSRRRMRTRDTGRTVVQLGLDDQGELVWPPALPKSAVEKRELLPGSFRLSKTIDHFRAVITWYTGVELLAPYCAQTSGWTPTNDSMIAAVTEDWGPDRPACGSFLQLKPPGDNMTSIIVRVVDLCGGCKPLIPHVDLSVKAFEAFYSLNVGLVESMKVRTLTGLPVENVTDWSADSDLGKLYGPSAL